MKQNEIKKMAKTTKDIEVLEELSKSKNIFIKLSCLNNPIISKKILEQLCFDEDIKVSSKAIDKILKLN